MRLTRRLGKEVFFSVMSIKSAFLQHALRRDIFLIGSTPKPHQRQFLKSICDHRLHRLGRIAFSPKILSQPITYFRFTVAQRQIAIVLKKQADVAYRLIIFQANGKTMRLAEDVFNNLKAFRHTGMRMPAAHRPYFRVVRLFINRFSIGQRPRAKYQAGCFSYFHL